MDQKQYDLMHDKNVAHDFNYSLFRPSDTNSIIKSYSLFIKKPVSNTKFIVGKTYIGTRICINDELENEDAKDSTPVEYEESTVIYIEDRYINNKGQECITAATIYREILKRDKKTGKVICVQKIYDSIIDAHSHFYVIELVDGIETILSNRVYNHYLAEYDMEDLTGVRISSIVEAELRGWWLIKENWTLPKTTDPDMPF